MFQPLSSFGMGPKFRRLSKHPCLSSLWHLVTNFELRLSDRHDQMIKPTAMARQPFSFQPADEEPFVYTCAFAALFADVDQPLCCRHVNAVLTMKYNHGIMGV